MPLTTCHTHNPGKVTNLEDCILCQRKLPSEDLSYAVKLEELKYFLQRTRAKVMMSEPVYVGSCK